MSTHSLKRVYDSLAAGVQPKGLDSLPESVRVRVREDAQEIRALRASGLQGAAQAFATEKGQQLIDELEELADPDDMLRDMHDRKQEDKTDRLQRLVGGPEGGAA